MNAKIIVQSVCKSYQQNQSSLIVFDKLSVEFVQGNSYAIMGASGSGKSTLIHLIAGVDQPTVGNVFFQPQAAFDEIIMVCNISSFDAQQSAHFLQKNISIVFQQPYLFPELTVLENVMLKAILAGQVTFQSHDHARALLREIGLEDKADVYPATLSGGQQQRIAILRAIFIAPQFLLVDEPTGNLDEKTGDQVIDLLLHYHKKYNMGLIVSTHSKLLAQRMQTIYKVEHKKLSLMNL